MNPTYSFREGVYVRDADGTWRYGATGLPVPGATDVTLADRVPAVVVGSSTHGAVWVSRSLALTDVRMRELLGQLDAPAGSFPLPHPVDGLPADTPSVMILPVEFWNNHAGEVVDINAPELHPSAVLVIEDTARAVGLTPESLMEYVRRGVFPQPPVRLGRTPAWPRPVVQQWLANRRSPSVACEGCGETTEITGLMAKTSDDTPYTLPLCSSCGERVSRLLPGQPRPWTVGLVRHLLQARTD